MPDGGARFFQQAIFTTDDGAPLWFEQRGEGPEVPAVLCDGLGCDGFIWRYLWGPLAARRRVLHWNYRGHGKSGVPRDDSRIGVEYICDDLARLMDHTGLDRAVIFGHSMGVQVALEFHRRHASRVAGLVLVCGSYGTPLDTWHDHSLLRVVFPRLKALVEKFPSQARWLTSHVLRNELAVELGIRAELNPLLIDHHDFHPYMEHLAKMHPLYFVRTLDSLKDHSALDHLPFVRVPALVVGGEIDKFTPVWLSQRMAEHLPDAKYLFVPGGSHTAPLERTALVNGEVEQFLASRIAAEAPAVTALP
jgi:pimeloyl-ACP methyl ester carboxylesterase